jgi:hypothetical protein
VSTFTDIHGRPARATPVEGAGTAAFKLGDRVCYVGQRTASCQWPHTVSGARLPEGIGLVVRVTPRRVVVNWPGRSHPAAYMPHNLEKL